MQTVTVGSPPYVPIVLHAYKRVYDRYKLSHESALVRLSLVKPSWAKLKQRLFPPQEGYRYRGHVVGTLPYDLLSKRGTAADPVYALQTRYAHFKKNFLHDYRYTDAVLALVTHNAKSLKASYQGPNYQLEWHAGLLLVRHQHGVLIVTEDPDRGLEFNKKKGFTRQGLSTILVFNQEKPQRVTLY